MSVKREGKLNNLESKAENGARRGLILASMVVVQRAQGKVHVVSGRLKRSLDRGNPYVVAPGRLAIDIGSNVEYAEEEETREGTKDGTPHAYLRPALDEARETAKRLIAKSVIAAMRR